MVHVEMEIFWSMRFIECDIYEQNISFTPLDRQYKQLILTNALKICNENHEKCECISRPVVPQIQLRESVAISRRRTGLCKRNIFNSLAMPFSRTVLSVRVPWRPGTRIYGVDTPGWTNVCPEMRHTDWNEEFHRPGTWNA